MKTIDLRKERERQRRESYKECILHAAEAVIVRKGFAATTMDDIAREAQFSKATLYNYFKGKSELIQEIVLHFYDDIKGILKEILALEVDPTRKLRKSLRASLEFFDGKENLIHVLLADESLRDIMKGLAGEAIGNFSAAEKRFVRMWREKTQDVNKLSADILKEGIRSGEFRDMDIPSAVTYINALLQGVLHLRSFSSPKPDAGKCADMISGFLLRGFAGTRHPRKGEAT